MSQLPQLATKADIARLEGKVAADMADREARLVKWIVGCGFLYAGIAIAGVSIVV